MNDKLDKISESLESMAKSLDTFVEIWKKTIEEEREELDMYGND